MPLSKIEVDKVHNIYYRVSNISHLKEVLSPTITIRGVPWTVIVRKEKAESGDAIVVGLKCERKDMRYKWTAIASASFHLLSTNERICRVQFVQPSIFCAFTPVWCNELIDWDDLLEPANGFIVDDSIRVKVSIEAHAEHPDGSIEWKKMPTRKSRSLKFRMALADISELANVRSPIFRVNDHPFAIDVVRSKELKYEDEVEDYLTVFLRCFEHDTISNWQVRTRLSFTIVPFGETTKPFVRRDDACDVFNKDDLCFGWTDLMAWADFADPSKCYVKNDRAVFDFEIRMEKDLTYATSTEMELSLEPQSNVNMPSSMETDGDEAIDNADPNLDEAQPSLGLVIECLVCSRNMVDRETSATVCGHLFCTQCIFPYISRNKSCPNCRTPIGKMHIQPFTIPK